MFYLAELGGDGRFATAWGAIVNESRETIELRGIRFSPLNAAGVQSTSGVWGQVAVPSQQYLLPVDVQLADLEDPELDWVPPDMADSLRPGDMMVWKLSGDMVGFEDPHNPENLFAEGVPVGIFDVAQPLSAHWAQRPYGECDVPVEVVTGPSVVRFDSSAYFEDRE